MTNSKSTRKDVLVETAYRLFNEHGYHATGIDKILAESGVSKATMYKYFRSKEELILEVLKRRHLEFQVLVNAKLEAFRAKQPAAPVKEAIQTIFDALTEWFNSDNFFGCNFINASAEYSKQNDPVHSFAAEHKNQFQSFLISLFPAKANAQAVTISEQLLMLIDGAIVNAQIRGDRTSAEKAKQVAMLLLREFD